jgi:hypothetical protein
MAKLTAQPKIELKLRFDIDEEEARALDALAGYGDDAFINVFYEKLGAAYMRDHEDGLRRFLKSVSEFVPGYLSKVNEARKVFTVEKVAISQKTYQRVLEKNL